MIYAAPYHTKRIDAVDALRGAALLGIMLYHYTTQFNYAQAFGVAGRHPNFLNKIISTVSHTFLYGKMYTIFTFIFGITYYLQYKSLVTGGANYHLFFTRRLLLLACFGFLNGMFFPSGDILVLYSILGFIMLLLVKLPGKILIPLAFILLLQPVEWFFYFFKDDYSLPTLSSLTLVKQVKEVAENGTIWQTLWVNATKGQLAGIIWSAESGRFTQALGLLIIGFIIARKNVLANFNIKKWSTGLLVCAGLAVLLYAAKKMMGYSDAVKISSLIFSQWLNLAVTGIYISLFLLLYHKNVLRLAAPALISFGKMSLTNYLLQSITGALIFYSIGLHMGPTITIVQALILFGLFAAAQMAFSTLWFKNFHYKYGPVEFYWRKLAKI